MAGIRSSANGDFMLSGGQKQRIAIARAMIRQAEILVLDDSLSAVDVETEKKILSELINQRKGKTTLLVSHRVSTLRHADYVVVLEDGQIIEEGRPEDLEKTEGFYGRMARLQSLVQSEKGTLRKWQSILMWKRWSRNTIAVSQNAYFRMRAPIKVW